MLSLSNSVGRTVLSLAETSSYSFRRPSTALATSTFNDVLPKGYVTKAAAISRRSSIVVSRANELDRAATPGLLAL
jgi:hypothetical protein